MGIIGAIFKVALFYFLMRTVFFDLIFMYTTTPNKETIEGKRVLVTGASMGIGEQAALHYCKLGAELIITARSEDRLKNVQNKCLDFGNKNVFIVTGDMSKTQDVKKVADFVVNKFDTGIDHVILNHVGSYRLDYFEGDINFTNLLLQINYVSYMEMTTYLLPSLNKRSGSLVVISSVAGRCGIPFCSHYTGTKFALEGFFASLRVELQLRKSKVSVTVIPFGFIGTANALKLTELINKQGSIHAESSEQAGWVVLQAAVGRPTDLFFPWYLRIVNLLRDWAEPMLREIFTRVYDISIVDANTKSKLV